MKKFKIIGIIVISFFIFFIILRVRSSRQRFESIVESSNEIESQEPDNVNIYFDQYIERGMTESLRPKKIDTQQMKQYHNYYIPPQIEEIIQKIKLKQFDDALLELREMQEFGTPSESAWALYFEAHISFLQGRYTYAKDLFNDFVQKYPTHELITNASEAINYISEW
ncbi:MAG: hypothetical protein ACQESP_02915 [Candidatus Muiribacteriota bacterium]